MILYKKQASLRVKRAPAPAAAVLVRDDDRSLGPRRAEPMAIDYLGLRASAKDKLEVSVCDNARDELERMRLVDEPVLIDAAEQTEVVFRRGEEVLAFCEEQRLSRSLVLTSARGRAAAAYRPCGHCRVAAGAANASKRCSRRPRSCGGASRCRSCFR